jgi:hypothetical protein
MALIGRCLSLATQQNDGYASEALPAKRLRLEQKI